MNIALDPQTEANLRAIASQLHVSVETYLAEVIKRDAVRLGEPEPCRNQTLHEFLMHSPLRGARLDLERDKDYPRSIEVE